MTKPPIDPRKIVVLSGAGLSAPSGLKTFRDSGGLWEQYRLEDVATPEAWARHPQVVLDFYNARRAQICAASPNAGHYAIAELEKSYEVVVVTQNIDDLHERAGSTHIIHVHGELTKARSTADDSLIYEIGDRPIHLGDLCPLGSQLRPHIVWFGENVMRLDEAQGHFLNAGWVLVVGTSLTVFPAAGFVDHARYAAKKVLVDLDATTAPFGFRVMRGSADVILPMLVQDWCRNS
jgi:NAD-dependent deacetylase